MICFRMGGGRNHLPRLQLARNNVMGFYFEIVSEKDLSTKLQYKEFLFGFSKIPKLLV